MSHSELMALAGFICAAVAMLLVTQTKDQISALAWLVPTAIVLPIAVFTGLAITEMRIFDFLSVLVQSDWGLVFWFNGLVSVAVAFFLLQDRARAAGLKSEVWVLIVIFTGCIGLLLMLARTLHSERNTTI